MPVIAICDLGFGDSGKGAYTDSLCRSLGAPLVVRYNGGAQAGHNVHTKDGRHHTFSQFGSGTLVPGTETLLSRYVTINPLAILSEADHLKSIGVDDPLGLLFIEEGAPVVTPFHKMLNQARENVRGIRRHGSCGMGIGEVSRDCVLGRTVLQAKDLQDLSVMGDKLNEIRKIKTKEISNLISDKIDYDLVMRSTLHEFRKADLVLRIAGQGYLPNMIEMLDKQGNYVVFEGAQGLLLDETYGFHPYCSWSDTTFHNAKELMGKDFAHNANYVGVIRGYMTRHGEGPFPTESLFLTSALPDLWNSTDMWQGSFRVGDLDLPLLKYSLRHVPEIEHIVVTNMDRLKETDKACICIGYDEGESLPHTPSGKELTEYIQNVRPTSWATFDAKTDKFEGQFLGFLAQQTGKGVSRFEPPWMK